MTNTVEHAFRPGSASLSILSFAGLGALGALLWQIAPGYVLLLMIPALAVCLWQMVRLPRYSIRMTQSAWHILGGTNELVIPTVQIAYLQIVERGDTPHIGLMLDDGTEVMLPVACLPDPLHLIREATAREIPVREFS